MGRGVDPAQVDLGAAERAGADDHREVLGLATGEHRVDRDDAPRATPKRGGAWPRRRRDRRHRARPASRRRAPASAGRAATRRPSPRFMRRARPRPTRRPRRAARPPRSPMRSCLMPSGSSLIPFDRICKLPGDRPGRRRRAVAARVGVTRGWSWTPPRPCSSSTARSTPGPSPAGSGCARSRSTRDRRARHAASRLALPALTASAVGRSGSDAIEAIALAHARFAERQPGSTKLRCVRPATMPSSSRPPSGSWPR